MIGGERHKCHREHFIDPRKIAEVRIKRMEGEFGGFV